MMMDVYIIEDLINSMEVFLHYNYISINVIEFVNTLELSLLCCGRN